MDPRRTLFVGGAALTVIVALAAGNVFLWQFNGRGGSEPSRSVAVASTSQPQAADVPVTAAPHHVHVEPSPFDGRLFAPLRPVDARTDIDGATPQPLTMTADASPLHGMGVLPDREILALIDEELPGANDVEREVWLEELRDVDPEAMRRILRLWRQQHAARPAPEEEPFVRAMPVAAGPTACEDGCAFGRGAATAPRDEDVALFALDAGLDHDQLVSQIAPSLEAIGQARDVILNNVANAGTAGFKRFEVHFGEAGTGGEQLVHCDDGQAVCTVAFRDPSGAGAAVAEIRLDMSPGRAERTRRPLDVAISGEGFLQVRSGDELLLTRAGRLMRGGNGQLVVTAARGDCALEPPIVVPDEAVDVKITGEGAVLVRLAGQEEPFEAGRLLLARCADPTALAPRGGSLYAATRASGPAQPGTPGSDGLGTLRQGALEQSNVDLDREAEAFRRLQQRIQVLSQIVTAPIPVASARPMQLVAAPPAEEPEAECALDGGPALAREPGLIDEYLETRQAGREDGPELR